MPRSAARGPGSASLIAPLVLAAAAAAPSVAQAQTGADLPDATYRPTRGVFLPDAARAGEADATAVEMNPGQLPFLRAGALALGASVWREAAEMPGRGAGLMLATPVWGGGGFGLGLQGVAGSDAGPTGARTKFQLAYGVGGRTFGLGISWSHLFGDAYGGTDTFDAGIGWRPWSFVALGVVVEDFARPRLPSVLDRLPRRWVAELALRPTGTDRLELAAAGLHVEDDLWSRMVGRFRGALRGYGPWRLFADLELAPRRAGAPANQDEMDWRLGAGVSFDLDRGTLALAARRAATPEGVGGERWGGSALYRSSGLRNPDGVAPAHVVRVNLDDVSSDRAFLRLVMRLRAVAADSAVAAVLLKLDSLDVGMGRLEELRDLVTAIRRRGKPVVAHLSDPSTRELYLASACTRVVVHPAGSVRFAGLAQTVTFFKGALDRLGVAVDLVRIAEFKGAMEPLVMTGQSEPVRKNRNALLDDVYGRVLAGIAAGRRAVGSDPAQTLDPAGLTQLVAEASFTPVEAARRGLVDAVQDDDGIEKLMREALGSRSIAIRDLDIDEGALRPRRWTRGRVAVVMVDGNIVEGGSRQLPVVGGGVVGSDTLVEALERCRRDSTVRAVVLRVNSPGGSAFGSDVVARKVALLRASGKPVVASFGDVAASGGYYVAAPANIILAEPSTTTGSIGVYGFKLDVSRLLGMVSVNAEVYKRGPHADLLSPYRAWTADERQIVERKIRHLYDLFVGTVAEGRKARGLDAARVNDIGRGQVWTGSQARGLGLVDALGGVGEAIDLAAALGGLPRADDEPPELLVLPRPRASVVQRLLAVTQAGEDGEDGEDGEQGGPVVTPAPALRAAIGLVGPYLFGPGEGIEARLPYDLDWR